MEGKQVGWRGRGRARMVVLETFCPGVSYCTGALAMAGVLAMGVRRVRGLYSGTLP